MHSSTRSLTALTCALAVNMACGDDTTPPPADNPMQPTEEVIIETAGFFLSKILGQFNFVDDLPSLDEELYRNLMFLKAYEGDCEELGLNFAIVSTGTVAQPSFDAVADATVAANRSTTISTRAA